MAEGKSSVGEVRIKPDRLHAFTMAICRADGSSDQEARLVADHLVLANLFGHDSHGVGMIPHYIQNTGVGACVRNNHAKIIRDNAGRVSRIIENVLDLSRRGVRQPERMVLDRWLNQFWVEFCATQQVNAAQLRVNARVVLAQRDEFGGKPQRNA